MVDTNDEWITRMTGIKQRHIAAPDETSSIMGAKAAAQAIEMAGIDKNDIDMILFNTITPDMVFPASACLVQNILQIENTGTVDIEAACSGFVYGLSMANAYVTSGMYKNVLVVSGETLSRITDWTDRATCILFGDGAGAVVVSASEDDSGFIGFKLGGEGQYKELLYLPAGGSLQPASHETVDQRLHYMKMNGNATFKIAVRTMGDLMAELLEEHGYKPEDLKWLVPHQANIRIISSVGERLGISPEKVFVNIQNYGNTSAATIPIALREIHENGQIQKGDLVGMVAFGGGMTWGAALLEW
jgi:3-oxoacyl-[acyl-carrier-protein] synthase-3